MVLRAEFWALIKGMRRSRAVSQGESEPDRGVRAARLGESEPNRWVRADSVAESDEEAVTNEW